jgi:predicted metal-binding membrane protein
VATAAQILAGGWVLGPTATVPPLLAGGLIFAAGVYQFSSLKHACLSLCQRPFPFFFANWTDKPSGIFELGLRQGLYCLGCCWPLMLVMFAVGIMNVVWMALLGALMTTEKMMTTDHFARALGVCLITAGAAVAAFGLV